MWKTILLFILLSPGVLLTIPSVGKKFWMNGKTSLTAAIVHGILFAILLRWLDVDEGFQVKGTVVKGRGGVSIMNGSYVACASGNQIQSGTAVLLGGTTVEVNRAGSKWKYSASQCTLSKPPPPPPKRVVTPIKKVNTTKPPVIPPVPVPDPPAPIPVVSTILTAVSNVVSPPTIEQKCGILGTPSDPGAGGGLRFYTQDECQVGLGGNYHANGECTKPEGGSYSWDCRFLNDLSTFTTEQMCGVDGYSSSDGGIRLYSAQACAVRLKGNWHANGECTKVEGGSYSWDCRFLNSTRP